MLSPVRSCSLVIPEGLLGGDSGEWKLFLAGALLSYYYQRVLELFEDT